MKFFDKSAFYDCVHKTFGLQEGMIQVYRAEMIIPDMDAYVFLYSRPYTREGKQIENFRGKEGIYIYCYVDSHPTERDIIKEIEDWYGQKSIEVAGKVEVDNPKGIAEILLRVPTPKSAYWAESSVLNP
jgi:hypothetical protein